MYRVLSLFTLLFVFTGSLLAQDTPTVEEIAAAYIENIGGADAWKAAKNMRMTGKASMQGMEFPLTITTAEGDMMRIDVNVQGQQIIQATDGETAWQVMPFQGINEPTPVSEEEAADMNDQEYLNEFIDYADRGYVLTAVEGREIEGAQTLGVQVTKGEDVDRTYFFDPEYMIPVAMIQKSKSGPMKGMESMTVMSDYEEVGGLVIPMFLDNQVNGQSVQKITVTGVETNVALEEDFFSLPKKEDKKMEADDDGDKDKMKKEKKG